MVTNRAYIEKLIYDTFNAMDPSGKNTSKYKELYSSMSDKEFEKYMKEFINNPDENFILDVVEFEDNFTLENCEKAAKVINVPLMEYVYMPHLTMDKSRVIVSKEKCLVGVMNVKRPQQFLHKKNGLSLSEDQTSSVTGQVVGEDKNARDSDIEAAILISLDSEAIVKELHGPRSDDPIMKREMNNQISTMGYVSLEELTSNLSNKVTLNTLNTYLLSMGIKSDIVRDDYILPKIIDDLI